MADVFLLLCQVMADNEIGYIISVTIQSELRRSSSTQPANGVIGPIVIGDMAELVKKNDILLQRKVVVDENNF